MKYLFLGDYDVDEETRSRVFTGQKYVLINWLCILRAVAVEVLKERKKGRKKKVQVSFTK